MSENMSVNNENENDSGPSHSNVNGGLDLTMDTRSSVVKDEKPETVQENSTPKKGTSTPNANNSTGKKKRKKCMRDAKAPKQPLTGYFRFLNDRREKVRSENPSMPFSEITKQLAAEWNVLPADIKQQYLDAAEQDKERYNREFNDYKQTDAYKIFLEKQSAKKKKKEVKKEKNEKNDKAEKNGNDASTSSSTSTAEHKVIRQEKNENGIYEIPIFTEEFLEHNKVCESELRQLRKSTTDYESQNAILQRHVDSLHAAVNRLETDTSNQQAANEILQRHLDTLRSQLACCFANIPLAGTHEGATLENIDSYVDRLDFLANSNMEPSLRNTLRSAVSRLDLIK
jgi:hypothetical protein